MLFEKEKKIKMGTEMQARVMAKMGMILSTINAVQIYLNGHLRALSSYTDVSHAHNES